MIVMAYITAQDRKQAETIGRSLLEKKLAACINILDGMTSQYWWKGKIETASEVVLIIKTVDSKIHALTSEVKKIHSYETPCVLAWPISEGNADYLRWLEESIKN